MKEYIYKYDTHCHTSEVSWCGNSSAKDMVEAYYGAGYSGMVITDHFVNGFVRIDKTLPWPELMNAFCSGYEAAYEAAKKYDGFDVFFGWEFNYHGTEFLTYGLLKDFLLANPDMLDWTIEEYFDQVHKAGGFLIHAHPYRERDYIEQVRLYPNSIDAVEVVNSSNNGPGEHLFDEKAKIYADKLGLPGTRGTDCHDASKVSGEGLYFKQRLHHIGNLINAIKSNEFR